MSWVASLPQSVSQSVSVTRLRQLLLVRLHLQVGADGVKSNVLAVAASGDDLRAQMG